MSKIGNFTSRSEGDSFTEDLQRPRLAGSGLCEAVPDSELLLCRFWHHSTLYSAAVNIGWTAKILNMDTATRYEEQARCCLKTQEDQSSKPKSFNSAIFN